MSGTSGNRPRRRRRHQGATTARLPAQSKRHRSRRPIDLRKALACVAMAVICAALIGLVWINTEHAVHVQQDDIRSRAEAALTAQAATLAIQAQHELQAIDQSLAVLQAAWDKDPDTFSLAEWQKTLPALTAVADDLFIANNQHIIVQDIIPAAVGQGIGSAYATFSNGSLEPIRPNGPLERDNTMLLSGIGNGGVVRQYMMYLVRPLLKPQGWLIGASYKSKALVQVFSEAGLGPGGLAAMVDSRRGGVQAVAGTAALQPRLAIATSPLFKAMQARPDGGVWIGRTPIDGVNRIIAYRPVPGRDLFVLVGAETTEAMAPTGALAASTWFLAAVASLLILVIGGTVLWEIWNWRRTRYRRHALAEAQTMLESAQAELATVRGRVTVGDAQLLSVLGGVAEGVALIDRAQRLLAWNPAFAALTGLDASVLREGVLLEEIFRQQVLNGRFGVVEDTEAEIARRLELLRSESGAVEIGQTAPDGTTAILRAQPMPDGGMVLILRSATAVAPDTAEPEATNADPVEY